MKAKSTSRQGERRDRRRRDIIAAASRLFSELGYENVTLRAIAEEMGYAHATLYRYFPDKSSLLAEICRETFQLLTDEIDALATAALEPEQRLFETSRGVARFGLAHPHHFRIVFFGPEDRNGIRAGEYIDEIGRPMFDRLVQLFHQSAISSGLPEADPKNLDAHTWWSNLFGLTHVLILQGDLPHLSKPDRVIDRSLEVMWAGLTALARPSLLTSTARGSETLPKPSTSSK